MLTKVKELFHGQGRRGELGEALHLFRYPEDGGVFPQKLAELHFSPPTATKGPDAKAKAKAQPRRIAPAPSRQGSSRVCVSESCSLRPSRANCWMSFKRSHERRAATAHDGCCWSAAVGGATGRSTNGRAEMRRRRAEMRRRADWIPDVVLALIKPFIVPFEPSFCSELTTQVVLINRRESLKTRDLVSACFGVVSPILSHLGCVVLTCVCVCVFLFVDARLILLVWPDC